MIDLNKRYLLYLIAVFPALVLLPVLFAPMPTLDHRGVSIAGYFQAFAFLNDGIAQFTYLTPEESGSALHLHSLLSVPFLWAGIETAGRYVSLLSAIISVLFVGGIGRRVFNIRIALIACSLLWLHPLFMRFSVRWWPEALGIALTTGAIYAAVRAIKSSNWYWYAGSLLFLSFGITNHMWEATIALPLAYIYYRNHEIRRSLGVVSATLITIGFVQALKSLQPRGPPLMGYSVFNRPESLFTLDWLFHGGLEISLAPFALAIQLTIPIAILSVLALLRIWLDKRRDIGTEILILWIVSSMTILVALPDGWLHHDYYLWALLVPLALTGGFIIDQLIGRIPRGMTWKNSVAVALAILLMTTAVGYGGAVETQTKFQDRYTEIDGFRSGELVDAGKNLAEMDPTQSSAIVFVEDTDGSLGWSSPAIARVLIYGNVHVRERGFQELRLINDTESLENCEIRVFKRGNTVEVKHC